MERRRFLGYATVASLAPTAQAAAQEGAAKTPAAVKGVRITVLKRSVQTEFQGHKRDPIQPCSVFRDGQQFLMESQWQKPEGFCDWAWADLRSMIQIVHSGQIGKNVSCCTDGFRPVFFLLERVG